MEWNTSAASIRNRPDPARALPPRPGRRPHLSGQPDAAPGFHHGTAPHPAAVRWHDHPRWPSLRDPCPLPDPEPGDLALCRLGSDTGLPHGRAHGRHAVPPLSPGQGQERRRQAPNADAARPAGGRAGASCRRHRAAVAATHRRVRSHRAAARLSTQARNRNPHRGGTHPEEIR